MSTKADGTAFFVTIFILIILSLILSISWMINAMIPEKHDPITEEVVVTVTSIEQDNKFTAMDAEEMTYNFYLYKSNLAKKLVVGDKLTLTRKRQFYKDGIHYTENFQNVGEKVKEFVEAEGR